jgi:gliding motility-associated-like protein/uncharacterized repeat protein (TIGR01451 family)
MIKRLLSLLFISITMWSALYATHIVGGEINYKHIGNNDYEIRLTVYRDCFNGVPPFDDPASVGIFDSTGNLLFHLQIPFTGSFAIPPSINSVCLSLPGNVCYEYTTYIDTINLPPIAGGYQLAYQRCCRNVTLINIISPNDHGITCYASIPSSTTNYINSNPVFKSLPAPFICQNVLYEFDHSATDADGDSIYYELCTPLDGGDAGNPQPVPPLPPPYQNIIWAAGYSTQNMLGGVALTIDPLSGKLTAVPNIQGQFVIGVCAKEYRNGVLLGATKRDFQLNVVPCPNITVASIFNPDVICGTTTVSFQNLSYNANKYFWDFGDLSVLTDTTSLFSPTYTYPDTGYYTVTLIAYSPIDPSCTDTSTRTFHIINDYTVGVDFKIDTCNALVNFYDSVLTNGTTVNWSWYFGDNTVSNIHNPVHQYSDAGAYIVTAYFISGDGCIDTNIFTVNIPYKKIIVNATASPDTVSLGEPTTLAAVSVTNVSYSWQPVAGIANPSAATTTALPSNSTTYTVTVTNAGGCTATDVVFVKVTGAGCAEPLIFVPSAFSPNNDLQNDILFVRGNVIKTMYFAVYDRWGQKVFETSKQENGWDGKFKGVDLAPGVFDYYLEAECFNDEKFFKKGNITIIR